MHRRLKTEPAGIVRERLLAVSLGLKGELHLSQIAEQMGRSMTTIQTWFDNYREHGVAGLEPSKAPRGFACALHDEAQSFVRSFPRAVFAGQKMPALGWRNVLGSLFRRIG